MIPAPRRRLGWLPALLTAAGATLTALLLQNFLRANWQVRTLPERIMEWLLLFVPLDLFERGLARFGADAKSLALTGTALGLALTLVGLGAVTVRAGWTGWRLLALGLALWFFVMAVVMPLTGAGFFATGLVVAPLLTSAGYLTIFLAYATVLLIGAALAQADTTDRHAIRARLTAEPERRALVAGLMATLVAYGLTRLAGRDGGLVSSSLPLARVPPRTPAPATATPIPGGTAIKTPTSPPVPTAMPESLPAPPPERRLARDTEGSLTAARRPKGTLAPTITRNEDFYVVTKNAVADPVLDAAAWRLVVDGDVASPVQLDYAGLRALPAVDLTKTLECISNLTAGCTQTSFGCDLLSTARWTGVRVAEILDLAGGLQRGVVGLAFYSSDEFSAGLTVESATDPDTLVVYQMNGQVLPREHGYPARLLVPGRYGMKGPKWLVGIRAMRQPYTGWYDQRGWTPEGIVKTMSRIDVPVDGASLPPGTQRIAGIAYAGIRGIDKVEFSADGGETWEEARFLEPPPSGDAMVRWEGTFSLEPGARTTLVVRATDGTGEVQPEPFVLPQPDGSSGWDSIDVRAA